MQTEGNKSFSGSVRGTFGMLYSRLSLLIYHKQFRSYYLKFINVIVFYKLLKEFLVNMGLRIAYFADFVITSQRYIEQK
jgi:hypothetical protein